jgi:beta-alanine degradation protein BauB
MKSIQPQSRLSRRQVLALLTAFGVAPEISAQDATRADPRSYRVLLENDRVRVIDYKSRPGMGVCGEGLHSHPAHVTVAMTGGKIKVKTPEGKTEIVNLPSGTVIWEEPVTHSAESIGGPGTRMYLVELKDKNWKPSTG